MYVYLLSTLPSFRPDDPPPMTVDDLVERCRPFLAPAEIATLADPHSDPDANAGPGGVARRWLDGEIQLRNAVARRRAAVWQVAAEGYQHEHRGFRVDIEAGVARAFEAPDPLQRERALDALRWHLLDDIAGLAPWEFAGLFAYAMRLRLAQAWRERHPEDGSQRLRAVLDRLEAHHV